MCMLGETLVDLYIQIITSRNILNKVIWFFFFFLDVFMVPFSI